MKAFIAPLAGFGLIAIAAAGAAHAAAPAYCALYAREYANQFTDAAGQPVGSEQRIQDEAYYRCLNQDEEPELPATSAYSGTGLDAGAQGGPFEPLAVRSVAAPAAVAKDGPPASAAPRDAPSKSQQASNTPPKRSYYGSGLAPWTPEWKAWCQAHFPNSFDEKTGTILPYNGPRTVCR